MADLGSGGPVPCIFGAFTDIDSLSLNTKYKWPFNLATRKCIADAQALFRCVAEFLILARNRFQPREKHTFENNHPVFTLFGSKQRQQVTFISKSPGPRRKKV